MADETKQVDILKYVPAEVRESPQMIERCRVENPEFNKEYALIDKWSKNFTSPYLSDEDGIKIYEGMLGITPDPKQDLDGRIADVVLAFNEDTPFTLIRLHQILYTFAGEGNYDLTVKNCELHLTLRMHSFSQVASLYRFLERMLPMNILYHVRQECIETLKLQTYMYVGMSLGIHVYPKSVPINPETKLDIATHIQQGLKIKVLPKQTA